MPSFIEEMHSVKFPRDNNTSPVAVQYVFNPTAMDVLAIEIDFHFESDTLGSRYEAAK